MPKIFKVGGCVRDELLGLKSKDIDFTFVLDDLNQSVEEGFVEMTNYLKDNKYEIFLSTPEMYTIRAKFPIGHINEGLVADFVMARREIGYIEGTRKPLLALGRLEDDLIRRDFTLNAMAQDDEGNIIDLFNGKEDLRLGILKTPKDPIITMEEDPLRILRAIRFSITKNFILSEDLYDSIKHFDYSKMKVVSEERIREELYKCFKHNTYKTLYILRDFILLEEYIFHLSNIWLEPTLKQK
jgi:poly(A) polymerase